MKSSFFGISMLYFLSLIPPGMIYLATVVLLWGKSALETFIGRFQWGAAIGLGLSIILGFLVTPIGYVLEIYVYRKYIAKPREEDPYPNISETIVEAHALGISTEFVYTTWGWMICHFNICVGVLIILLAYLIGYFIVNGTSTLCADAIDLAWKSVLLVLFVALHGWVARFLDQQRDQTFRALCTAVAEAKLKAQGVLAPDDLERIEGIGPKIASALRAAGIMTYGQLAETELEELKKILMEAGVRTEVFETWPEQAKLAAERKWEKLRVMQEKLTGGRKA